MKSLYFDCFCGAAGDMVVGALIDAGADFARLCVALESLGVDGFTLAAPKVVKKGIQATHFQVTVKAHHHHPHRRLRDILAIIEAGDLPDTVKAASAETFRRVAGCEAEVHGTTPDEVHFHEVGAVDSIVDIVGAHLALHDLGIDEVASSALPVGFGTIKGAHGVMPIPAPATAKLLQGAPFYGGDVEGELVTPTGAALITQLARSYGPVPAMRLASVGYGCGTRDVADRANVLRVLVGETESSLPTMDTITVVEANIDDMNPELFPPLIADLLARGARDAFLTPILGKKGRPAYLVTVLCDDDRVGDIVPAMFHASTTLGVRIHQERRVCLDREWKSVATPWGAVRVKIGRFRGAITSVSPEFEDCRKVAEEKRVPVLAVYEMAHAAGVKGEVEDV
jgi:pyridinium-3,5-bisthiocarboxylic acid mononucleotide nickel chelatase